MSLQTITKLEKRIEKLCDIVIYWDTQSLISDNKAIHLKLQKAQFRETLNRNIFNKKAVNNNNW